MFIFWKRNQLRKLEIWGKILTKQSGAHVEILPHAPP
jgi:hypothetical protein